MEDISVETLIRHYGSENKTFREKGLQLTLFLTEVHYIQEYGSRLTDLTYSFKIYPHSLELSNILEQMNYKTDTVSLAEGGTEVKYLSSYSSESPKKQLPPEVLSIFHYYANQPTEKLKNEYEYKQNMPEAVKLME